MMQEGARDQGFRLEAAQELDASQCLSLAPAVAGRIPGRRPRLRPVGCAHACIILCGDRGSADIVKSLMS